MADIILENICHSFDDKSVLSNFSAVFPEASVTCVMGESGCGKTTLLNIIMGLLAPDSGKISGIPDSMSAVFQEDRLCEDFSAVTNIRLAVGNALSDNTVEDHLTVLGLIDSIKKPIRELSGGQKRRVAIVRCILADSKLVILDEPFKGLDDENRRKAAEYVMAHRNGRTVIAVTHDAEDALLLNANVLHME